jgi:hypothetical protein
MKPKDLSKSWQNNNISIEKFISNNDIASDFRKDLEQTILKLENNQNNTGSEDELLFSLYNLINSLVLEINDNLNSKKVLNQYIKNKNKIKNILEDHLEIDKNK